VLFRVFVVIFLYIKRSVVAVLYSDCRISFFFNNHVEHHVSIT